MSRQFKDQEEDVVLLKVINAEINAIKGKNITGVILVATFYISYIFFSISGCTSKSKVFQKCFASRIIKLNIRDYKILLWSNADLNP